MLIGNFFEIKQIEKGENRVMFTVSIHPEHQVFKGHFPQRAVVPGVFTLQMIKECLEINLNKKWRYDELINCKFTRPILPEQGRDLKINCEYTLVDTELLLKATVKVEEEVCLSLKGRLFELKITN
jgi:3-hydroxyacyl-[acyl-carrier-protein] dehydratase